MFNFFKKNKNVDWIISAKGLKKKRLQACKILSKDEIKSGILAAENDGQTYVNFFSSQITKEDKWYLRKQRYSVYIDKYVSGKTDVTIRWD